MIMMLGKNFTSIIKFMGQGFKALRWGQHSHIVKTVLNLEKNLIYSHIYIKNNNYTRIYNVHEALWLNCEIVKCSGSAV